MASIEAELEAFFRGYGESFADGARLGEFYGDCAMAATPTFYGCLKGEAEVRATLAHVAAEQVRTGMRSLAPLGVEVTPVDARHWWACVRWGATFERTGDRRIEFDISYLVRRTPERLVILLYVAHQDEQAPRERLA